MRSQACSVRALRGPSQSSPTVSSQRAGDSRPGPFFMKRSEITVEPLSTLTCTGNQEVRILAVSFDLTLTGDDLPPVHLTG